jgi:hypothetical protein
LPQFRICGQRTGNEEGGGVLDQSVLTRPAFVSWKETVPVDETESAGLPRPSVVHPSTNRLPVWLLTVTLSRVGVVA